MVLPVVLGFVSKTIAGHVGNSGLTVIDLHLSTIMVISFISIAISLPSTLVSDQEIGWLRRSSTTPVPPSRLLRAPLIVELALAVIAVVIIFVGGTTIFGARVLVSFPLVIVTVALAVTYTFSLPLVVFALVRTETQSQFDLGVLSLLLLFLSGRWVQPVQISGPLRTVMCYSPSGVALRAILCSVYCQRSQSRNWSTWLASHSSLHL